MFMYINVHVHNVRVHVHVHFHVHVHNVRVHVHLSVREQEYSCTCRFPVNFHENLTKGWDEIRIFANFNLVSFKEANFIYYFFHY